jgi:integrase/recombinase XerD
VRFLAIQSLNRDEILRLLAAARAHSEFHFLMILVAFAHGLRASEVVNLKVDDVRDGILTVQRLKGSKKTVHSLLENPEPLLNEKPALLEFIRNQSGNQRIFPRTRSTFWRIMQRHAKTAGLAPHQRHPHCLKHAICKQLIGLIGIEQLQQYVGHQNLSSTACYLKETDQEASAAAARALQAPSRI